MTDVRIVVGLEVGENANCVKCSSQDIFLFICNICAV